MWRTKKMPDTLVIDCPAAGGISFVWRDELAHLLNEGTPHIERVSDVEWEAGAGGWVADLSRIGGPKLGPYPLRQGALDAEREWLMRER